MGIGPFELIMIGIIALIFFGPSKLPALGRSLGEGIRGFKKALNDTTDSLNREPEKPPVNQSAPPAERSTADPQAQQTKSAKEKDPVG